MDFKNKIVLITGGCSGIGKIMGRKSLERGCEKLVIWDINEEGLATTKQEFSKLGGEVSTFKIDLSNLDEIKIMAQRVRTEVCSIDILINNAGIVVGKYFHEHTHEQIVKSMSINTTALMHTTLEFLPGMIAKNSGAICNIASSAGLISNPKMSVYASSKWAVVGWGDSVRLEMQQLKKNVSVTTIMPFFINTGMFDGVKSKVIPILEPERTSERMIKAIEKETKMFALPLPYWFIRLSQGLLPIPAFDWVMDNVFGVYDTMKEFIGRK
ncbi:SDR family oxidoreductase [Kaistella antarctica]|uniref:Fatty acyl-CoA reductase n=1 Tax=Kaistella antarctica TaxID=266748 RepID=A0A448NMR9_9FLAO|nr:SDR family oxidoreductase [Kaistella antarctica]KEY19995.1 short-chain dehydrogenase [Kaistella antarctica]SEV94976.1 all-trans-retinol dehydrogenase (NAD+) [Kaistella antarctica]VEH95808.1 Fatty acyl-CoA reductase [Kaistella antarctica]